MHVGALGEGAPFFCGFKVVCNPPRSLGMCGLIKLIIYRQGVSDVWHCTRDELKEVRTRLAKEGWVITHTEVL